MTNKPFILLGVVAALAMAGGHAKAAECPATDLATVLEMPDFSCTIGDRTFEDFRLTHVPMGATVSFAEVDDNEVTVTLSRGAAGTLPNGLAFDYRLAITSGTNTFTEGALGNDVTQRRVTTTTTMTGPNGLLGMATSVNGAHEVVFEGVRVPFVEVTNISTVSAGSTGVRPGRLNGLSNDFFEGHPAGAPEPMSLSLFGLGLAGLALARRRRT